MKGKKTKASEDGAHELDEVPEQLADRVIAALSMLVNDPSRLAGIHVTDQVKTAARLLADTLFPPPAVPTADRDNGDQIVVGLHSASETESDPMKKERLWNAANMIQDRMKWELVESWPDLFKLYRCPDGRWKAELGDALEQRKLRLEAGVMPSQEGIISMQDALGTVLFAAMQPRHEPPHISDIPTPMINSNGGTNWLEIHKAALNLFYRATPACIVLNRLQGTLGPRIKDLTEGSREERLARAEELKKDVGKVIDGLAAGKHQGGWHGNRSVHQSAEGASKLPSVCAIEAARQLVEEHHELPSKASVRHAVLTIEPGLADSRNSFWSKVWHESGLDRLPRGRPVFARRKRPAR